MALQEEHRRKAREQKPEEHERQRPAMKNAISVGAEAAFAFEAAATAVTVMGRLSPIRDPPPF